VEDRWRESDRRADQRRRLPQSPEDGFGGGQPQFTSEMPLAGRTEDDLL
jgi:hypothetical protein